MPVRRTLRWPSDQAGLPVDPIVPPTAAISTFRVSARAGVWNVSFGKAFFGDFLTRSDAVQAACVAARNVEARGGEARVVAPPRDALIPHSRPPSAA